MIGAVEQLHALPEVERADVVVVAAGMDGALASVVGGLVAAPVIALPITMALSFGPAVGRRAVSPGATLSYVAPI